MNHCRSQIAERKAGALEITWLEWSLQVLVTGRLPLYTGKMHWPLVAPWQRSPRWPPSESVTQQLPTTPAQNLRTSLEGEERPCARSLPTSCLSRRAGCWSGDRGGRTAPRSPRGTTGTAADTRPRGGTRDTSRPATISSTVNKDKDKNTIIRLPFLAVN